MKEQLKQLLTDSILALQAAGQISKDIDLNFRVDRTKDAAHGDYSSNIAMVLAKAAGISPRALAEQIKHEVEVASQIKKVEIAGPGFINFFVASENSVIKEILEQGDRYGFADVGKGKKVIVEFVSANPTGPLHVGHGRGAAYGSVVSELLSLNGYQVHREYYVNDAGRQMNILAVSIWLRYLEILNEDFIFPTNAYRGQYVIDIANEVLMTFDKTFYREAKEVFSNLPKDEPEGGDKDQYIDALIDRAQTLLDDNYDVLHRFGTDKILADIQNDLSEFGVEYDEWFSEKTLLDSGAIKRGIDALKERGEVYEKDGAIWFRSEKYGDDKDHVLVRSNGVTTYFASDVAYHWNKINRGFEEIIDILGADHHGYVARVRAAVEALGLNASAIHIPLVQFAVLWRGGEKVQMSTRSGEFVTLRELRNEVGNDAARFFYIMRKSDQHMDFDLDLAKSKSNENPVYYIQYAYARICSVFRQLTERSMEHVESEGLVALDKLTSSYEQTVLKLLLHFPETMRRAVDQLAPHLVTNYLRDLATAFHAYYNAEKFIVEDAALRNARLCLISAIKQVLANGLYLLKISTPEVM